MGTASKRKSQAPKWPRPKQVQPTTHLSIHVSTSQKRQKQKRTVVLCPPRKVASSDHKLENKPDDTEKIKTEKTRQLSNPANDDHHPTHIQGT